jgi:hypothetical protein
MSPHGFASATAQQWPIGSVSKERLFSATVEAAEQRAREARKEAADVAACEAKFAHERLWRPGAALAATR